MMTHGCTQNIGIGVIKEITDSDGDVSFDSVRDLCT